MPAPSSDPTEEFIKQATHLLKSAIIDSIACQQIVLLKFVFQDNSPRIQVERTAQASSLLDLRSYVEPVEKTVIVPEETTARNLRRAIGACKKQLQSLKLKDHTTCLSIGFKAGQVYEICTTQQRQFSVAADMA